MSIKVFLLLFIVYQVVLTDNVNINKDSHKIMKDAKVINDVIHGHLTLSPTAIAIIDTPEFQRLRKLKQLGLTSYVFPGATHTRFEHCIGTYHLARQQMLHLQRNQPELNIVDHLVEIVAVAGLCHDLGHGPFSHTFEHWAFEKYKRGEIDEPIPHEKLSILILKRILERTQYSILSEEAYYIISALIYPEGYQEFIDHYNQEGLGYLFEIVSNKLNGIDVDKFDYLTRDSYYTHKTSSFDYDRLLIHARVIHGHICYPEKEVYNVYELFRTRYSMHRQVYMHKVVKAVEFMMIDLFEAVDELFSLSLSSHNPDQYLQYTDSIIDIIEYLCKPESRARKLLQRIHTRNLYKCIEEEMYSEETWNSRNVIINDNPQLRVQVVKLNYGMANINPVDNVRFYTNSRPNESYTISKEKVSPLLPHTFIEYHRRVYTTDLKNENAADLLLEQV